MLNLLAPHRKALRCADNISQKKRDRGKVTHRRSTPCATSPKNAEGMGGLIRYQQTQASPRTNRRHWRKCFAFSINMRIRGAPNQRHRCAMSFATCVVAARFASRSSILIEPPDRSWMCQASICDASSDVLTSETESLALDPDISYILLNFFIFFA